MKKPASITLFLSCMLLAACNRQPPQSAPVSSAPATSSVTAPTDIPTAEDSDRAHRQALLDYAVMEDKYINDPRAQWATSAKASSTFGDDNGNTPADSNLAVNVTGVVDGNVWTNNRQEIGFDWLELTYDKPVAASEVRLVFKDGAYAKTVTKVELQDTDGKWNVVWSGLSDVKADERGSRTWFVRSFEKTAYKTKAVKFTIANNLVHGYKTVDAAQLVGD